jgi:hypothetical protein
MIATLYQVDFIKASCGSVRLLDYGDRTEATLEFGFEQTAAVWRPAGQDYGNASPLGGSRRPLEFQRLVNHASHAAAAAYAMRYPASLPMRQAGKVRVSISGGEVWDFMEAVILGVSSRARVGNGFRTMTGYKLEVGKPVPVSGLTHAAGVRMDWILETHSALGALHSAA